MTEIDAEILEARSRGQLPNGLHLPSIDRYLLIETCRAPDGEIFAMAHFNDNRNGRMARAPVSKIQIEALIDHCKGILEQWEKEENADKG